MVKRIYAIMGATGHIGSVLSEELLNRGHQVRVIGRTQDKLAGFKKKGAETYAGDFTDHKMLENAFQGASAVFCLIPPSFEVDNLGEYQDAVGEAIVKALLSSKVPYALNLSSIGAHLPEKTGPIKGLYRQEQRLNKLTNVNILHLRPSYFMDNILWMSSLIKNLGVMGTSLRSDLKLDMISTKDIGQKAADFLEKLEFSGKSFFDFVGPRAVNFEEVSQVIGKAIGNPDLKYVQFSYEDAERGMKAMGLNSDVASSLTEMYRAFNDGLPAPTQKLTPDHRGTTTIEEFALIFAEHFLGKKVST